jgi:hypothetical protein
MTRDLRALADDLQALGVTRVALEATGVLWKPVWNVLEGRFTLLLVHPRHLKRVTRTITRRTPGRASRLTPSQTWGVRGAPRTPTKWSPTKIIRPVLILARAAPANQDLRFHNTRHVAER